MAKCNHRNAPDDIVNSDKELERILNGIAQCDEGIERRGVVKNALQLRSGEKFLEVGYGLGAYTHDAAQRVGPQGRVCAIDSNAGRVELAREYCREFHWVECVRGDLDSLSFPDRKFNAAFVNHTLESAQDINRSLKELWRVLKPDSRLIILSTNWSSLVWHSSKPTRMQRVLNTWKETITYQDLPSLLPGMLRSHGFEITQQIPLPVFNDSFDESSISFWTAHYVYRFVRSIGGIDENELDGWYREFDELHRKGDYFFCSTPMITVAERHSGE